MHHRMLHRALMREEARPVVLGMAQSSRGRHPGEDLLTRDSEDSTLVTSDEEEGGEPEKAILENGLWVWRPGDDGPILARVGGANLPIDGGGTATNN